jgi:hypothetical protein
MNRKAGDSVRIYSKEWVDAQEKDADGDIFRPTENVSTFNFRSFKYAGMVTKICAVSGSNIYVDIDGGNFCWGEWMFDSGYKPAAEPLAAEDAVIAMVQGKETLYDDKGYEYKWDNEIGRFEVRLDDKAEFQAFRVPKLYRGSEKRKRPRTRWEILAWANSDESQGWFVRGIYIGDTEARACWREWQFPQSFRYDTSEDFPDVGVYEYQRARLLPDLSGIDESTIQGFEVEE